MIMICLDSGSTTDIFCNDAFVNGIFKAARSTMTVDTNGGEATTDLQASVKDFGMVWFMKHALTNIFSLCNMVKKYRVTFDSAVLDNAFFVHLPDRKVRFGANDQGIYIMTPEIIDSRSEPQKRVTFLQTVEENKKFYKPTEVAQATKARALLVALGSPSVRDLKTAILTNAIKDNPVTTKDVTLADAIFGPDIGTLKGKSVRTIPTLRG